MEGHNNRGFTLIELMIVLAIVAVTLGLVVPGMQNLMERNRLQSSTNSIYSTLMSARSEALKRNKNVVVVCKLSDGSTCDPGSNGGVWRYGWLVHPEDDPSEIILERPGLDAGDTLWAVDDPNSPSTKYNSVSYGPNGTASAQLSFVICNPGADTATARVVDVEVTGRPTQHESAAQCTF